MEELFKHLELRIHKLLKKSEHLKSSNQHIQQGQMSLVQENERLMSKQKGIVNQIENMVLRLKTKEGM